MRNACLIGILEDNLMNLEGKQSKLITMQWLEGVPCHQLVNKQSTDVTSMGMLAAQTLNEDTSCANDQAAFLRLNLWGLEENIQS